MATAAPARKRHWKRWLIIITTLLVVFLLVVAFLLPYLLKRTIETHSEEWIDRKIIPGCS